MSKDTGSAKFPLGVERTRPFFDRSDLPPGYSKKKLLQKSEEVKSAEPKMFEKGHFVTLKKTNKQGRLQQNIPETNLWQVLFFDGSVEKLKKDELTILGSDIFPAQGELEREKTLYKADWMSCIDKTLTPKIYRVDVPNVEEAFCLYNVFTKEESKALICAMEKEGFGKTSYPKKYRGNLRLMLHEKNFAEILWSRMKSFVPNEISSDAYYYNSKKKETHAWKADGLNDKFRCSKYYPGDAFGQHCDAAFVYSDTRRSHFTVNIYLNNIFKGGCTRFFPRNLADSVDVKPEPGMALIFRQPPDKGLTHDGERVEEGLKYLLRTDIMYQRTQ